MPSKQKSVFSFPWNLQGHSKFHIEMHRTNHSQDDLGKTKQSKAKSTRSLKQCCINNVVDKMTRERVSF